MRKINRLFLLLVALLLVTNCYAQEEVTITTYYPSPYGSYRELTTTDNTYLATQGGKVGIGTTNPEALFHISDGSAGYAGAAAFSKLLIEGNSNAALTFKTPPLSGNYIYFQDSAGWTGGISYTHASDTMAFYTNGQIRANINGSGNVGIGTTNPAGKLTVYGNSNNAGGREPQVFINGGTSDYDRFYIGVDTTNHYASIEYVQELTKWGPLVLQQDGGNVGIGTTTPEAKLHVSGDAIITDNLYLNNTDIVKLTGGAGSTADYDGAAGDRLLSIYSQNAAPGDDYVGIKLWPNSSYPLSIRTNSYGNTYFESKGSLYPFFDFRKGAIGSSVEVSGGGWYLGRGDYSRTPDSWLRLTHYGRNMADAYCDFAVGKFWANGAQRYDLSEVTPAKEEDNLEQGDVVVIDKKKGLRVTRSSRPYDASVYGIVSSYEQAAMIIGGDTPPGEEAENRKDRLPIALIGRVTAKVSAENGPIEIGDLLTTSATAGYAMKATEPKIGTILGKALEPLKKGKGEIKVLVTLQ